MNILGINGLLFGRNSNYGSNTFVHDSGVTLLINGELKNALLEERFSRKKHDGNFPYNSLNTILAYNNITINNIDIVSYVDNMALMENFTLEHRNSFIIQILKTYFKNSEIKIIDHHEAHAFSTFINSSFDRANVLTFDFSGDTYFTSSLTEQNLNQITNNFSFSTFDRNTQTVIKHQNGISFASTLFGLGAFYSDICYHTFCLLDNNYINKNSHKHGLEGKIMGLAGYGNYKNVDIPNPFKIVKRSEYDFPIIVSTEKFVIRERFAPEDFAAWGQKIFEDTLCDYISNLPKFAKEKNLCLAGGCALNVLANSLLLEKGLYEDSFVCSAPSDEGLSMGAAYHTSWELNQKIITPKNTGCIGIEYNKNIVEEALKPLFTNNDFECVYYTEMDAYLQQASLYIKDKNIICWYHGPSEFGPRALGNRSIFVNPIPNLKNYLNDKIKYREYWRPYAGIVLEEKLNDYFDIPKKSSDYMMFSSKVKEMYKDKLEGITHVDGTCRIQTVNKKTNFLVSKLLKHIEKEIGFPILLNTSFNILKGEPIIESPFDAVNSFVKSNIEVLAIEGFLITKRN